MFLQNILKRKRVLHGASFRYSRRRVDLPLVPTKVFMDLENLGFPKDSDKALVINNIIDSLLLKGYFVKSIQIYTCDDGRFSESYLREIEDLEALRVTLIRVEKDEDKRDDVDHLIKEHISNWKLHYQPPAAVLLLSSDGDYSDLVVATLRDGFEFFIAYDENRAKPEFPSLVKSSNSMLFKELARGTLLQANGGDGLPIPRPPSPPSPPIRNQPSVTQDNKLKVMWDIGSCPIPVGASAVTMKKNLENMLQKSVYSMDAYGRPDKVPTNSRVIKYLSNSGIKVNTVEALTAPKQLGQGVPDEVIKMKIYDWCSSEKPHIPVLLITDDKRFAFMFEVLTAKGFQISLAHTSEAPEELTRSAPQRYIWDELVKTPKQETVFGRARERTPSRLHMGAGFTVEIPIGWEQEETHEDQEVFRLSDKFHSHLSVVVSPATVASMSGFGSPEEYYNQSEFRNFKLHNTAKKEFDGIEYFYFITSENEAHQVITATIHGGMLYICKAEEGNKGARKSAMDAATSFRVF